VFKKIGAEMMEDPLHKDGFLEPFKSQGVFEFNDVGMVMRGKFMAKPGSQFTIRKEIYNRVKKEFGESTQVVNFPVAYFAINIVIRPQAYPAGFGHQIRSWFVKNSNVLAAQAMQWENHLPAYYWADISGYEKQGYEALVAKIRNRYVDSGYYDAYFVELIKRLRCLDDPKYLECRK